MVAENTFANAIHAIDMASIRMFRVNAAFLIDHRISQKTGGDNLILVDLEFVATLFDTIHRKACPCSVH